MESPVAPRPQPDPDPPIPGFIELPAGKIAAVATYLEMLRPPARVGAAVVPPFELQLLAGDLPRYRALFATVGRPWLWFSRACMRDSEVKAIIDHPDVDALACVAEGRDVGIAELDWRRDNECELAFFGLVPDAIGRGLGRALIVEAVSHAFSRPIERLWLHTCTLDHPAALRFYMKAGFRPFRRALEVADDPRLAGRLPRSAAPDVPIL